MSSTKMSLDRALEMFSNVEPPVVKAIWENCDDDDSVLANLFAVAEGSVSADSFSGRDAAIASIQSPVSERVALSRPPGPSQNLSGSFGPRSDEPKRRPSRVTTPPLTEQGSGAARGTAALVSPGAHNRPSHAQGFDGLSQPPPPASIPPAPEPIVHSTPAQANAPSRQSQPVRNASQSSAHPKAAPPAPQGTARPSKKDKHAKRSKRWGILPLSSALAAWWGGHSEVDDSAESSGLRPDGGVDQSSSDPDDAVEPSAPVPAPTKPLPLPGLPVQPLPSTPTGTSERWVFKATTSGRDAIANSSSLTRQGSASPGGNPSHHLLPEEESSAAGADVIPAPAVDSGYIDPSHPFKKDIEQMRERLKAPKHGSSDKERIDALLARGIYSSLSPEDMLAVQAGPLPFRANTGAAVSAGKPCDTVHFDSVFHRFLCDADRHVQAKKEAEVTATPSSNEPSNPVSTPLLTQPAASDAGKSTQAARMNYVLSGNTNEIPTISPRPTAAFPPVNTKYEKPDFEALLSGFLPS